MAKRGFIILGFLVILVLIAVGCGQKSDDTKERQDKARAAALERSAEIVVNDTVRYNLSVCAANAICATGQDCTTYVPITQPSVCKKDPILKCVCSEKTVCLMTSNAANTSYYTGKCFTADELKSTNVSQAPVQTKETPTGPEAPAAEPSKK